MSSANGLPAAIRPDTGRALVIARPDQRATLQHVALAGGTYTTLLSGDDTAGRYTLIDLFVLPGGGPPPHRHDFEEMFSVLEGEIEITCRGASSVVRAGETANVPATAPHSFRNASSTPARVLLMASPAGLERFITALGHPVESRTAPAPPESDEVRAERMARAQALAPAHRIEML